MPIDINGAIITTDSAGAFSVTLQKRGYYLLRSGLPALNGVQAMWFRDISGSGIVLGEESPLAISMDRRILLDGPACRQVADGTEYAYFPYTNTTAATLRVPLEYGALNALPAPVPEAPPAEFSPGRSGFRRLLSSFALGDSYVGSWSILGQELLIRGKPPLCSESGDPECMRLSSSAFESIRRLTLNVVRRQIVMATSLAYREWQPKSEKRLFILKRGARAISRMKDALEPFDDVYSCTAPPANRCRALEFNKRLPRRIFGDLYINTPRGLEELLKDERQRREDLERRLKAIPDTLYRCTPAR
jgi:hypothetical protein